MTTDVQETPEYLQRLGKFVQRFADVEYIATLVMRVLIDNTNLKVGAAAFPERMGIGEIIATMRCLHPMRRADVNERQTLDQLLTQLLDIAATRNLLLHNGAGFTPHGAFSAQRLAALRKSTKPPPRYSVSIHVLEAMAVVCSAISSWLGWFLSRLIPEEHGGGNDLLHEPSRTWRYTRVPG